MGDYSRYGGNSSSSRGGDDRYGSSSRRDDRHGNSSSSDRYGGGGGSRGGDREDRYGSSSSRGGRDRYGDSSSSRGYDNDRRGGGSSSRDDDRRGGSRGYDNDRRGGSSRDDDRRGGGSSSRDDDRRGGSRGYDNDRRGGSSRDDDRRGGGGGGSSSRGYDNDRRSNGGGADRYGGGGDRREDRVYGGGGSDRYGGGGGGRGNDRGYGGGRGGGRVGGRGGRGGGGRGGGRGGGGIAQYGELLPSLGVSELYSAPEYCTQLTEPGDFPSRPAYNKRDKTISLYVNHFHVELKNTSPKFHYDIAVAKSGETGDGVQANVLRRKILTRFMSEDHPEFENVPYVCDGVKNIFTPVEFPFKSVTIENVLPVDADDSSRRRYTITISRGKNYSIDVSQLTELFAGRLNFTPYETIQALDIAMRHNASMRYATVGRSFYSSERAMDLGLGTEIWSGYYQSLRPTQSGLTLNVDIANTAFLKPIALVDSIAEIINERDLRNCHSFSRDNERNILKALKGVELRVTHRDTKRTFKIIGFGKIPLGEERFEKRVRSSANTDDGAAPEEETETVRLADYFRDAYNIKLKYENLPCVYSGSKKNPIKLPIELCKIAPNQKFPRKIQDSQTAAMIRFTCIRPDDRRRVIESKVQQARYDTDDKINAFGMSLDPHMMQVEGKMLNPPRIQYGGSEEYPRDGSWNLRGKKFYNPMSIKSWGVVSFCDPRHTNERAIEAFVMAMQDQIRCVGMTVASRDLPPIVIAPARASPSDMFAEVRDKANRVFGADPDFVLCIKPDQGAGSYGDIKRTSDTEVGIVSQCMLSKHIVKKQPQYIANLLLKINAKLGGVSAITKALPVVSDGTRTIIIGGDVSHPGPGGRAGPGNANGRPSIAALSASTDAYGAFHVAAVRQQDSKLERIDDLKGMAIELLRKYYKLNNSQKPERIIFYRDGVSEGQFKMVLDYEIEALREACTSIEEGYSPKITFIVVQKRHHTRFFPASPSDSDRSGNLKAGTMVETAICHPTQFDFYLMSNAGLQGTSRPAHYHVLADDNNFSPEDIQNLTFQLCHIYVRCTKSVGVVPCVYYAHLVAQRHRFFLQDDFDDMASIASGGSFKEASTIAMTEVHSNLKKVMYFC